MRYIFCFVFAVAAFLEITAQKPERCNKKSHSEKDDVKKPEEDSFEKQWVKICQAAKKRKMYEEHMLHAIDLPGWGGDSTCLHGPSYAKAVCTEGPGRIVCRLGRYTFVINNGEHKMEPAVVERFAAMLYHRTQEGDQSFDISVDTPAKDEALLEDPSESSPAEPGTPAPLRPAGPPDVVPATQLPVYVECSPVKDDRRMCSPDFVPTEVVYNCRRLKLGIGKRQAQLPSRLLKRSTEHDVQKKSEETSKKATGSGLQQEDKSAAQFVGRTEQAAAQVGNSGKVSVEEGLKAQRENFDVIGAAQGESSSAANLGSASERATTSLTGAFPGLARVKEENVGSKNDQGVLSGLGKRKLGSEHNFGLDNELKIPSADSSQKGERNEAKQPYWKDIKSHDLEGSAVKGRGIEGQSADYVQIPNGLKAESFRNQGSDIFHLPKRTRVNGGSVKDQDISFQPLKRSGEAKIDGGNKGDLSNTPDNFNVRSESSKKNEEDFNSSKVAKVLNINENYKPEEIKNDESKVKTVGDEDASRRNANPNVSGGQGIESLSRSKGVQNPASVVEYIKSVSKIDIDDKNLKERQDYFLPEVGKGDSSIDVVRPVANIEDSSDKVPKLVGPSVEISENAFLQEEDEDEENQRPEVVEEEGESGKEGPRLPERKRERYHLDTEGVAPEAHAGFFTDLPSLDWGIRSNRESSEVQFVKPGARRRRNQAPLDWPLRRMLQGALQASLHRGFQLTKRQACCPITCPPAPSSNVCCSTTTPCPTTCPTRSTCPTTCPTTTCCQVPDPPGEVPACFKPTPRPPCCPPPTTTTCPTLPPCPTTCPICPRRRRQLTAAQR